MYGISDSNWHEEDGYHGAHYMHVKPKPYQKPHCTYNADERHYHGCDYQGNTLKKEKEQNKYYYTCHRSRFSHLQHHLNPECIFGYRKPRDIYLVIAIPVFCKLFYQVCHIITEGLFNNRDINTYGLFIFSHQGSAV